LVATFTTRTSCPIKKIATNVFTIIIVDTGILEALDFRTLVTSSITHNWETSSITVKKQTSLNQCKETNLVGHFIET